MSESNGTSRRGRFRFLYQFSLRTLLLATAGVAIFCNWYFQPKYHEDELAGKDLRVRQQMKVIRPEPVKLPELQGANPGPAAEPRLVNHGHYTLLDGDDFVLARGQFADGSESGRWVTYYPTGHKAAEGKMHSGVKVGLWGTWYEDGTLASEVTYADKPVERFQPFRPQRPFVITVIPVGVPSKIFDPHIHCESSREGPAKAWYASGQLRYEGQNRADIQEGMWKYHNEAGQLTSAGPYRAGKRHGTWTLSQGVSEGNGGAQTVEYIDGRTRQELDRLLARLERQLDSPQRYRRTQALHDLIGIGEGGVPLLEKRLAAADKGEQLAILGVLPSLNAAAGPLLVQVRDLAKSSDLEVAHQARLTLFQIDGALRGSLFDGLIADAIGAPRLSQCLTELVILYRSDQPHQSKVFAELMSLSLARADADSEQITAAAAQLGGDLGPHIAAALEAKSDPVRLQAAKTLLALFNTVFQPETYVSFDEPAWNKLLAGLKSDPSPEVRGLADKIGQGPQIFGRGGGGFF
jgi:hypothetical protein